MPDAIQEIRRLGEAFEQDPARTVERGQAVGHALLGVHERLRGMVGREVVVGKERVGKRLEARLARQVRARALLLLVGEVQILEAGARIGRGDGGLQVRREPALLGDGLQDERPPFVEFPHLLEPLFDDPQLGDAQAAGGFLPVPREERRGVPFSQQPQHRLDLLVRHPELPRDPSNGRLHKALTLHATYHPSKIRRAHPDFHDRWFRTNSRYATRRPPMTYVSQPTSRPRPPNSFTTG